MVLDTSSWMQLIVTRFGSYYTPCSLGWIIADDPNWEIFSEDEAINLICFN